MMIDIKDTIALASAVERFKAPARFLLDTFFPIVPTVATSEVIQIDSRKGTRRLAPVIVRGAKGVNMMRDGFDSRFYRAPLMAPSFVLDPAKVSVRGFGEGMYSTVSPAQRAAEQQARDLAELQAMIINRKNKMAADILTTGKCVIEGYADDGATVVNDTIDFGWDQALTPSVSWDNADAKILDDMESASEMIQESAGIVPTIAVVGKNVAKYILANNQIQKDLAVPNRENLTLMSLAPTYINPQVQFIGKIAGLNLEIYKDAETYTADDGSAKSFIPDDDMIIAVPGRGRQLHAAVTLLNGDHNGFNSFAAPYVPYYAGNEYDQELKLTMYSRCVLAPEFVDDWAVIHTKG